MIRKNSLILIEYSFLIHIFGDCKTKNPNSYLFLALQGAVALEDALSKGVPIQTEIDALRLYLDSSDKDSVLDLVLSSLPEETRRNGTDTLLQLNQKASFSYVVILPLTVLEVVSPTILLDAVDCYLFVTLLDFASITLLTNIKDYVAAFLLMGVQ